MLKLKYLFFVLISFSLLLSCEDSLTPMEEDELEITDSDNEINNRNQFSSFSAPEVVEDRLKFENYQHFKNYIQDLTRIYENNTEDFNAQVQNIVSFPKSLFNKFDSQEFEDPADRFIPAVTDEVIQSLLNEDYEVQIDQTLLTFITNDQIIASDPENTQTKVRLRNLEKGSQLSPQLLPDNTFANDKDGVEDIVTRSWCGCRVAVEQIDCNTVEIKGTCKGVFWGDGDGILRYDIVDDFNNIIFSESNINVNGNFEYIVDISNLPLANFIFVDVDSRCAFDGSASVVLTPGSTCDNNYRSTDWGWSESNGRAFSFQTKYDNNLWGDYVQAKMYSYRWSNGKWRKDRAELTVSVDADVRAWSCLVLRNESETKHCNNCSVKKAREYIGVAWDNFHFCTSDINGTFEKDEAGVQLNETNTVEFECCN